MGLGWLTRNLGGIIVWTIIAAVAVLTALALYGVAAGNTALANNTGAGAVLVVISGLIYAGGYVVAKRSHRDDQLQRVENSLDDVRARVTRIEDEQLDSVARVIDDVHQVMTGKGGRDNVRQFPDRN